MKEHVKGLTTHLQMALSILGKASLSAPGTEIKNALILGLGGSGIGGTIAAQVLSGELKVPVLSCKDYNIPEFVSENTLVIVSSYSGNTEETLMALSQAEKRSAQIYCICSGGKLEDMAREKKYNCLVIPGGLPPRGAFGYSFPQLFGIFKACGLIDMEVEGAFTSAIEMMEENEALIQHAAMELARSLHQKRIIIYSQSDFEGVGIRFRQQINENAKKLCWHHVIPEMNHNELVGWREENDELAVVILRNGDDFERNQQRMDLSKGIIQKYTGNIHEIWSKGKNKLEHALYLIHLCDWISVDIADLNDTDSMEIEVINYLKSELAKS